MFLITQLRVDLVKIGSNWDLLK